MTITALPPTLPLDPFPPPPPHRPSIDFERIDALIAWARKEHRRRHLHTPLWNQETWVDSSPCGTVCCIAGKVGLDDGVLERDAEGRFTSSTIFLNDDDDPDERLHVSNYAMRVLGLPAPTGYDDPWLFRGTNTIWDLMRIRDHHARIAGVPTRYDS